MKDCKTFTEFEQKYMVIEHWKYILACVAMLTIGLVSGFIIGWYGHP